MDTEPLPSGVEDRARDLLKLRDIERAPHALPIRNDWLWRAEGFAPRVPYIGSFLLPLGRKPDMARIAAAITALAQRHEALHSRLALENDIPILIPAAAEADVNAVPIPRAEIVAHREGRAAPTLADFLSRPFDLFSHAGFRARLFLDEEDEGHLAILMHHYYGDAWSSQIVRRDFMALYAGEKQPLPPVAQYTDYGLFQRRALDKTLVRQLGYWHRILRDAEPARLPYDAQGDASLLSRTYFLVEEDVLRPLEALAKAQRVSLGLVCFAGLQIALARWCGQAGMVTGLIAANRIRPQFQGTVGSLLSIIPVAGSVPPASPFRTFLMGFAKSVFDGIGNQDISVDNYNDIFRPAQPFGVPRFNFVPRQENFFVGAGDALPSIQGIQQASDIKHNSAYTDLHILMLEYPNGLLGRINHSKTLSLAVIKPLIESWQDVLRHIAVNPDASLGAL